MQEFPLSEEKILELRRAGWKKGEASRERYCNTKREKKEKREKEIFEKKRKEFTNLQKESFYSAGLMLYIAEGAKTRMDRINLANTNPKIIIFFIIWLGEFP